MRFNSLPKWLAWQEKLHFTEIDPGLERVSAVWEQLYGHQPLPYKIITVAGTNGKGSSVALLTSILRAAGYRTGSYTSPHLLRYNERIAVNGEPVSDHQICTAFQQIDEARSDISLTYFEFATLAAARIFADQKVEIAILEVGMGGRLDAVNLYDADIALITPISLDHTAWLGDTREKIGAEKAGIIRSHQPVVCSESVPPQTVIDKAAACEAPLYRAESDFRYQAKADSWSWQNAQLKLTQLPLPALQGIYQLQNSSAVLQVIDLINAMGIAAVDEQAIRVGLSNVKLSGRYQVLPGAVERIFDVTHNEQGSLNLAEMLQQNPSKGETYAVMAMLRDKDSQAVFKALERCVDHWFIGGLEGERGQSAVQLADALRATLPEAVQRMTIHQQVEQAYLSAMHQAQSGDRVLIFGSFHTVQAVMLQIPELSNTSLAVSA